MCGRLAIRDAVGGIRPPIGISEEYNHSTEHRTKKEERRRRRENKKTTDSKWFLRPVRPTLPSLPPSEATRNTETRKDQIKYSQNEERKTKKDPNQMRFELHVNGSTRFSIDNHSVTRDDFRGQDILCSLIIMYL